MGDILKWSKNARMIAKEKNISKRFIERNLIMFSKCGIKNETFYIRGNKIVVKG